MARGNPSNARDAPLGEGEHISGELSWLFLGVCLSPTPSRQPLLETSDNSNYRYRIVLPRELISITETDLWKFQQKSLIVDTDSALNSN